MAQYKMLNVKLSDSKLNKLKSEIKNGTEVTLNFSTNLIGSFNGESNFAHELLLTDAQVSKIRKTFKNGLSADITVITDFIDPSKILLKSANKAEDLSEIVTLNDIIKTVNTSKKFIKDFWNISETEISQNNNEIKDVIKIIKCLENRRILLKGTTKKNTSQEGGFLNFLKSLMRKMYLLHWLKVFWFY